MCRGTFVCGHVRGRYWGHVCADGALGHCGEPLPLLHCVRDGREGEGKQCPDTLWERRWGLP